MLVDTRNKPKHVLYKLESITARGTRESVHSTNFTYKMLVTMEHLNDSNQLLIEFTKTERYIYIT